MNLSASILGTTAVEQLKKSQQAAVLEIGTDRLTRGELARVGCYNFLAARILSAVLHKELKVKNLRQVYEEIPPGALALPRIGAISLAVLGAAFEVRGIGGATPLDNYVKHHEVKATTWGTMKHHEQAEQARERKEHKARKRARRNQAHAIRVDRFEQKQAASS